MADTITTPSNGDTTTSPVNRLPANPPSKPTDDAKPVKPDAKPKHAAGSILGLVALASDTKKSKFRKVKLADDGKTQVDSISLEVVVPTKLEGREAIAKHLAAMSDDTVFKAKRNVYKPSVDGKAKQTIDYSDVVFYTPQGAAKFVRESK